MGKRTEYTPGTCSYAELVTPDAAAAKDFYGGVFGWQPDDLPLPGGGSYTLLKLDGDTVAGLHQPGEEQPPAWLTYVTVEDADAAPARASELGASVLAGPFDVMEAGRMAVLADPQGAVFAVWQPKESIGATRVNDVGCLTMNELSAGDLDAAAEFYAGLFGWETERLDTGDQGPPYVTVSNQGRLNAGMTVVQGGAPPHWKPYFTVADCNAAVETIGSLGGNVLAGPLDIPAGRIAVAIDPQGAAFAIFEGDVDD